MTKIIFLGLCVVLCMSCNKDKKEFTLRSVKLNSYTELVHTQQNLFIKIVENDGSQIVLGTTGSYPSVLTLPATYGIHPGINLRLYKDQYSIQLWGDSTGLIGSSAINMNDYRIIFQTDMETKGENVNFSIAGSWK